MTLFLLLLAVHGLLGLCVWDLGRCQGWDEGYKQARRDHAAFEAACREAERSEGDPA